jgi:transcriptional repressor NrdR
LDSKVTDTRTAPDGSSIRRRRVCLGCNHRFFTNEVICAEYPTVIKRDGREEEFDCEKVKIGLFKAFKKEQGVGEKVDKIFNGVVAEVLAKFPDRVASESIGAIVMDLLKRSDPVAYMRFASVYKNFSTADDFASEFEKMSSQNKINAGG